MTKTNGQRDEASPPKKQRRAESPASSSGRRHGVSQVTRDIIRPSVSAAASIPGRLTSIEQEIVASQKKEAAAGAEKVRRQLMPVDSMLDVFAFIGRGDLDNWTTVSKEFGRRTRSAAPLRKVKSIHVYRNAGGGPYEAVFVDKFHAREVGKTSDDLSEMLQFFFGGLRGCNVQRYISIQDIPITEDFVASMRAIKNSWKCRGDQVFLLSLVMDVDVFELLRSFPCIRSISRQTLRFLGKHFHGGEHGKVDGILLGQLSSAGIREIGALVDHGGLTDEAVLDFLFANHDDVDADHPRRFELRGAKSLSPQFVSKLVKACRDSSNNDPFELYLTFGNRSHFDLQHLKEQVRQGALRGRLFDETRVWEFQFDDPYGLEVKIRDSRGGWDHTESGTLHAIRNCTPIRQIRLARMSDYL
ncbi:hypothetical protein AAVH_19726 [Aphelenchoides avenae]|nr:hypothetical protein AAVH_19726 [Aphelenchus avenae]